MAKPTKSNTKKAVASTAAAKRGKSSAKVRKPAVHAAQDTHLHYDKEELLADYHATFAILVKALAIGVGGAVLYFFGLITYLGGWGHTKSYDYIKEFPDLAQQYEYKGTKLPEFADPSILNNQPAEETH